MREIQIVENQIAALGALVVASVTVFLENRLLRGCWKKVLTCKPPTEKAWSVFLDFLRPTLNMRKKQRALFSI